MKFLGTKDRDFLLKKITNYRNQGIPRHFRESSEHLADYHVLLHSVNPAIISRVSSIRLPDWVFLLMLLTVRIANSSDRGNLC